MECFDRFRAQVPVVFGRSLDRAIAGLQARSGTGRDVVVFDRSAAVWGDLLRRRVDLCNAFQSGLDEVVDGRELPWPPQSRHPVVGQYDAAPLLDMDTGHAPVSAPVPLESSDLVEDTGLARAYAASVDAVREQSQPDAVTRFERLADPARWLALAWFLMDEASPDLPTLQQRMKHLVPALVDEMLALFRGMPSVVEASRPAPLESRPDAGEVENLPPLESLCRPEHELDPQWLKAFLTPEDARLQEALPLEFKALVQDQMDRLVSSQAGSDRAGMTQRSASFPGVDSWLDRSVWGVWAEPAARARHLLGLKTQANTFEQVVALDVVRGLVGRLAGDPLLLRPVAEAIVAVEPALLRLALLQPRFITQSSHPARRLLDTVLQRAVEHNDAAAPGFDDFYQPVLQAFRALNSADQVDTGNFSRAMEALALAWEDRDNALREQQAQRLHAIRLADERQALADRITLELSQLPEMVNAPGFVVSFLCGWWATVMAWSRLTPSAQGPDAQSCERVVATLLWSVRPTAIEHEADSVRAALPGLIQDLRQGLAAIGKTEEETRSFFDALMAAHQPLKSVRRDGSTSSPVPLQEAGPPVPVPASASASAPAPAPAPAPASYRPDGPWLDRRELESAGVEEARFTDFVELGARPASPASQTPVSGDLETAAVDAILDALKPGVWIDLQSQGEQLRAQLVWTNPAGSLFMFNSAGGRTHSMSRRSCIKLIQARRFVLVTDIPGVQQAMGSIGGEPPAQS
ncbi:MAG: DUF1631 family protein [Burkholderiaceae bacterium]